MWCLMFIQIFLQFHISNANSQNCYSLIKFDLTHVCTLPLERLPADVLELITEAPVCVSVAGVSFDFTIDFTIVPLTWIYKGVFVDNFPLSFCVVLGLRSMHVFLHNIPRHETMNKSWLEIIQDHPYISRNELGPAICFPRSLTLL